MTTTTKSSKWQHSLLKKMSAANPQPFIMGGYAEDAILFGHETRPHSDIDWLIPRSKLEDYNRVAKDLGLPNMGVYAKRKDGVPVYVAWTDDESFWIECVVIDTDEEGGFYLELGELLFDTTGLPPFKAFRIYLPPDTFKYPQTKFEDFEIKTISPLALYQIRTGLNVYKPFGDLRDKDITAMKALKNKFFPDINEKDLIPKTKLL
jgi:hypothetical protein